jgi:hypothetical protein
MKELLMIITSFLSRLLSAPSAVEIFIRTVCVCYIALGIRSTVRWWMLRRYKNPTTEQYKKIDNRVRGLILHSCMIASLAASWVYRHEFFPDGRILVNGKRISQYQMVTLEYEHLITEGILFGFGAVGFMFTLKFIEWLWGVVDRKYNFNLFKRRK